MVGHRPQLVRDSPFRNWAQEESRNDEVAVAKKSPSVETDRESYSCFAEHPPSVIVITPTRKGSKGKLNRFGFPSPSPTKKDKNTPLSESRNDEVLTLPPRPPTPIKSAFLFDNVSPIPSDGSQEREKSVEVPKVETQEQEKPVEVPKVEMLDSPATHTTPVLKNVQAEDGDPPVLSLSESNASTVSSADIPLRLDSYMSIDATPPPTPFSIPYDEKSPRYESTDGIEDDEEGNEKEVDQKDKKEEEEEEECEVAVIATAEAEKETEPVEEEYHNSPAEPSTSPMSHASEKSMRSTSILDREESFSGPIFVKVAPTNEEGKQNAEGEVDNWIGQVTECVNCDDTGAASTTENASTTGSIVNEDDSVLERKAADKAYASCEIEGSEMTCVDLVDEPTPQMASEANIGELSEAKPYAQLIKEAKDEHVIQHKEEWLETATEWARYEKSASPTTAEVGQVTTEVITDAVKNDESQGVNAKDVQNLNLAPSDEGFFDSSNRKNTGKSTGGSSQNSADKSTVCSTVALTEASNNEQEFKGDFQRNTSKGEFDEFLDRLTDCVSCWKLEPWPEQDLERE
jgi:hypothetical protein